MKIFYLIIILLGVAGMACGSYFDNIHLTVISGVLCLQGIISGKDR